ncbi:subtilase family AB5 toxin binding subunit [Enterovibrio nigricans]|uniref:Subtilase cytotoxin subunit B n=1 Tax=Enterovibrio nigricans DSM 22720 TaxID=1121868 RepID=A0A1T4W7U3_9GAMM|nr:subtilase family AB5 toxin binding subunit [Enterovibrio nigricans]PKF48805.1 subtilase cytotoxin subunit B [Enterovibrio nigricans]SKA73336.1 subtilase cytotoxin subunit B [Enterovibrio nigricans DSM 22720]
MRNFLLFIISITSFCSYAEWSDDSKDTVSFRGVIKDISVGQIDGFSYFCIEIDRIEAVNQKACSGKSNGGIWGKSYDTLYKQALFFYSTGQKIKMVTRSDIWKYQPFVSAYSSYVITGLSSCSGSDGKCFGPEHPSPR